jgi:hypothetical protein
MDLFLDYWWLLLIGVLLVPVVAITLFSRWLRTRAELGFDDKVKAWDVFIKLVSALTVIGSGAVFIGKYFDQREHAAKHEADVRTAEFLQRKVAFDTEIHQQREKLFREAKLVASRLAIAKVPADSDLRRFDELYLGDLIGIEQHEGEVERAMVRFRRKLHGQPIEPDAALDQLVLSLATATGTELKASRDSLLVQHKKITELVSTGDRR